MFCEKCGKEVHDEAVVCVHCGCSLRASLEKDINNEKLDTSVQIISFCFPIVGGILYFVHQNSAPQKSKDACHAALWGFGIGLVLNIVFGAMAGGMM